MENLLNNIKRLSYIKLNKKLPSYRRFLFGEVLNAHDKIIGIYGSRGVGKTTLMLQVARELKLSYDELLYISCDYPLLQGISLFELVDYFYSLGGKCIIIDEIHEAKDFEQHLKSIYDFFDIKIIFSGSSAIQLTNPSFARRYTMKKLPVLSFREFLELKQGYSFSSYTLEEMVTNHENIAYEILDILKEKKVLKEFREYLKQGAYPFYFESSKPYLQKIIDSINTTLHTDIAMLYSVPPDKITILKKLLATICVSKPLELSIEKLAKTVGVSRATLYKYIEYLHRAELLRHVTYEAKRFKNVQKPDKLYLSNTNLCNALCMESDIGSKREIFFANQLSFAHSIYYIDRGDFLVDEKFTVEIGGKNKGFKQIADIPNSFLACDDIEIGFGAKIPLWLFGFLY
jgi:predicted AAA+ superfamily ATPase